MGLVLRARRLQRRFVGRPRRVDVLVGLGEVDQQRRPDARHVFRLRLAAVERHRGGQFGIGHRRRVRHAAAVAEAGDADLVRGARIGQQELDGGEEVVHEHFRIDLRLQLAAALVVAGVAADGAQAVGRQRSEAGLGHAPGDVLDVGVEAAVLVHHHHAGHRVFGAGRHHQVAAHLAMALRRGVGDVLRADARVGERDLLRQRIVRAQRGQQGDGAHAPDRQRAGAVQELPAAEPAVHVTVVELEQLGRKVLRGQAGHVGHLSCGRARPR